MPVTVYAVDTACPFINAEFDKPAIERSVSLKQEGLWFTNDDNEVVNFKINENEGDIRNFNISDLAYLCETISTLNLESAKAFADELKAKTALISLSDRITMVSKELNLSKTFLAKALGVSRQTIYDWLEGKNSSAKDENLNKIAWLEALNYNLSADIKTDLWSQKSRILPDMDVTIEKAIIQAEESPENIAQSITLAFKKWTVLTEVEVWKQKSSKELLHETSPNFTDES